MVKIEVATQIEGTPVMFDSFTMLFYVTTDDKLTFSAKSASALAKKVIKYREKPPIDAMLVGYSVWYEELTKIKATKSGRRTYAIVDGRKKPVRSYDVLELDNEKFKRLSELKEAYAKLDAEWDEIRSSLKEAEFPK